jgi:hypothetical protein
VSKYFARLLHIGHRIVTWVLENLRMNVTAHCPGSRKTATINANGGEAPAPLGDLADTGRDASQRDFAMSALAGTQRARLIDAACKAFLTRRGLDPNGDRASFNEFLATRVRLTTLPGKQVQ